MISVLAATVVRATVLAAQPDSGSELVALDKEVLEATLVDLVSYAGDDSPLAIRGRPPGFIIFAPDSVEWPITVEDALRQQDACRWRTLPAYVTRPLRESADHLVWRTQQKKGFTGFQSTHRRVKRFEESTPEPTSLAAALHRPISAWPPRYSKDRALALVRLSIPWSIHHADATYVLAKFPSRWVVLAREFCIYV